MSYLPTQHTDNAHVTQTRLILLDAPMILFQACALYCYVRFAKLRYREFTPEWWTWLVATGVFLALNISCKMVGLFMFLTVGSAVLVDLWNILDVRRGYSMVSVRGSRTAGREKQLGEACSNGS